MILDADEELTDKLAKKLKSIVNNSIADFYRLPRKNLIFSQWIRHSRWWPDYNIRFFKKGSVSWSEIIHSVPETHGKGQDLLAQEGLAIVHHHYESVSQYLTRSDRYSSIQAKAKIKEGYEFSWRDLIRKPVGEFLSRLFVGEAYKDGVHGLALSLLQAYSELLVYLKVWELNKFKTSNLELSELEKEFLEAEGELDHWLVTKGFRRPSIFTKVLRKLTR